MATKQDIAILLSRLMVTYPNFKVTDVQFAAEVWMELLGDLPQDLLKMAVMQYSSEAHEFAPSAGTLRDYAMRLQARAAGIPDAYQAYSEVCKMPPSMMRTTGPEWSEEDGKWYIYQSPVKFSHEIVAQVAELMGWPKSFPTDSPGVDRAQFIKAYDAQLSKIMAENSRLPQVAGYIEQASQKILQIANQKRLETK